MNYEKMDKLRMDAKRAVCLADFLDKVWGDLTHAEGTWLLAEIEELKRQGWVWH